MERHEDPRRRLRVFLIAFLLTFTLTRLSLVFRPNADFNLFGYNIHHLYTGSLVLTACVLPLLLGVAGPRVALPLVAGSGVGLSLVLDEVVYLIATDGSNASYLTRVSWIGAVILIGLCALYAIVLVRAGRVRSSSEPTTPPR